MPKERLVVHQKTRPHSKILSTSFSPPISPRSHSARFHQHQVTDRAIATIAVLRTITKASDMRASSLPRFLSRKETQGVARIRRPGQAVSMFFSEMQLIGSTSVNICLDTPVPKFLPDTALRRLNGYESACLIQRARCGQRNVR